MMLEKKYNFFIVLLFKEQVGIILVMLVHISPKKSLQNNPKKNNTKIPKGHGT
jgi:hypothetical protein